jgi:hypothetical protein
MRLGGYQRSSGSGGEEKFNRLLPGFEPLSSSPLAVTLLAESSWFLTATSIGQNHISEYCQKIISITPQIRMSSKISGCMADMFVIKQQH